MRVPLITYLWFEAAFVYTKFLPIAVAVSGEISKVLLMSQMIYPTGIPRFLVHQFAPTRFARIFGRIYFCVLSIAKEAFAGLQNMERGARVRPSPESARPEAKNRELSQKILESSKIKSE